MKNKKSVLLIIMIAALVFCLAACNLLRPSAKEEKPVVYLSLNGGDGVVASDFISGSTLVAPSKTPVKQGYEFAGWYAAKDFSVSPDFGEAITEDVYIYARWRRNGAEGTFVVGGGQRDIVVVAEAGRFVPPTASRKGYEFRGWYTDAELTKVADFDEEAKESVFYAKWELARYSVTYDCEGLASVSLGARTEYTVEDAIVLQNPVGIKHGFEFLGWYNGGEAVTEIERGTVGDLNFKAKFISGNNEIVEVVGGSAEGKSATAGVKYSETKVVFDRLIRVSDRAGFTVKDNNGEIITEARLEEGNNVFTVEVVAENGSKAEYTLTVIRYSFEQKTVTFVYPAGTQSENRIVYSGERIEQPQAKKILGYGFSGWFADAGFTKPFDFNEVITENSRVYSKYTPERYTISYNYAFGKWANEPVAEFTVESALSFSSLVCEDTRYGFDGWYLADGSKSTGIALGTVGDVELFARYTVAEDPALTDAFSDGRPIMHTEVFDWMNRCAFNRLSEAEATAYVPHAEENLEAFATEYLTNALNEFLCGSDLTTVSANLSCREIVPDFLTLDGMVYDSYRLVFSSEYPDPTLSAAETDRYEQINYHMHGFASDRGEDYDGFAINSVLNTVAVADSDQLYYAVTKGYRPVPAEKSAAERLYGKAKRVLREIVGDGMSEEEKAHAVFDWLVLNVAYDYDLLEWSENNGAQVNAEAMSYKGFALEGVFDDGRAVCDGISKAFALLCGIEGIECVQVTGEHNGTGHAWNKLKIDGRWYNVDPTSGGILLKVTFDKVNYISAEGIAHRYFMRTDAEFAAENVPSENADGKQSLVADTEYSFYEAQSFVYNGVTYDYVVESEGELNVLSSFVLSSADGESDLVADFNVAYETDVAEIQNAFSNDDYFAVVYTSDDNVIVWLVAKSNSD